jgi:SAM-dependent methyltransferase
VSTAAGPAEGAEPESGAVEALEPAQPGVAYWRERARTLGARAVVNVDHPDDSDLGDVTDGHREALWPLLAAELTGDEQVVLDVGCGTGRLTAVLAALRRGS